MPQQLNDDVDSDWSGDVDSTSDYNSDENLPDSKGKINERRSQNHGLSRPVHGSDRSERYWTQEEDAVLIRLYDRGMQWDDIAAQLIRRTSHACSQQHRRLVDCLEELNTRKPVTVASKIKGLPRGASQFEVEQTEYSTEKSLLGRRRHKKTMSQPSASIPSAQSSQTYKQVENSRTSRHSEPELGKHKTGWMRWSEKEDKKIARLVRQGLKLSDIVEQLPQRTQQACIHRIRGLNLRRKTNRYTRVGLQEGGEKNFGGESERKQTGKALSDGHEEEVDEGEQNSDGFEEAVSHGRRGTGRDVEVRINRMGKESPEVAAKEGKDVMVIDDSESEERSKVDNQAGMGVWIPLELLGQLLRNQKPTTAPNGNGLAFNLNSIGSASTSASSTFKCSKTTTSNSSAAYHTKRRRSLSHSNEDIYPKNGKKAKKAGREQLSGPSADRTLRSSIHQHPITTSLASKKTKPPPIPRHNSSSPTRKERSGKAKLEI